MEKISKRIRKSHLGGKTPLNIVYGEYFRQRVNKVKTFEQFLSECLFIKSGSLTLGKDL